MNPIDCDRVAGSSPIPLTILTGFLGAGKTTLLNRILNGDHGLKVAVLVNDFGAINVDAELVVGLESDVISLANGCVCCTIRDDLLETVLETIDRPERPEYLLLEASGVAEPSGIAMTFHNPGLRERIRLDSILCVVDAEQVFAAPELMELKEFQVACADLVILNKVDLVDHDQIDRIKAWLDNRFHRYHLIEASRGNVPLEVLLSVGRFDPTRGSGTRSGEEGHWPEAARASGPGPGEEVCSADTHHCHDQHDHDHANAFSTWSYETTRPLSLEALRQAVSRLPGNIYRVKGVIHTSEEPGRRVVLQVVGRRVDLSLAHEWRERQPRTRIVVIGASGTLDGDALKAAFEGCISPHGGRASEAITDEGPAPALCDRQ